MPAPRRSAIRSTVQGAIARRARRLLNRVRGRQTIEDLVALGLDLGQRTTIAHTVYFDPGRPWLISVGDDAVIAPSVMIFAHDASMRQHAGYTRLARVRVGKRTYIGAGAILLPGTVIGDDAVVGAGAVVSGTVPPGTVVAGNPARVLRDVGSFAERHRAAAAAGPSWPFEGWSLGAGITGERRASQRAALTEHANGYLRTRLGAQTQIPDEEL